MRRYITRRMWGSYFGRIKPLLPNYKWVPIGYHGSASSIVVSGAVVRAVAGSESGRMKGADVWDVAADGL